MTEARTNASLLEEAQEVLAGLFRDLPALLEGLSVWHAVVLIPLGLVSLLYGLKMFKGMVAVYAAITGGFLGWVLASQIEFNQTVGAIIGALALGLLAWPLFRYAVGVFGGVAGGILGALVVCWIDEGDYVLLASGIGLVGGVVLAFVVFKAVVIFMTSLIGANLVVVGVVALVMTVPSVREPVATGIEAKRYLLPVLVGVPALIGALYQIHWSEAEERKMKKKMSK